MTSSSSAPKVGFVSLGCPKNLTDSELILTQLSAEGYQTARSSHKKAPAHMPGAF